MELSTEAIDNQGLFSDHYLENVFGNRPNIQGVFASADNVLARATEIHAEEKKSLTGTKEGQTEKRFIRPILDEVLGWDFIVQETVQGQKSFGEPDYAMFSEPETYRTASEEASDGQRERVFRRATALAEAKKWHLSLDGTEAPATEDGAPSQGTPGAQLLRYFQWTHVPWGLLTNGNRWRLYTSRVPSPVDTYLEFDLEHILEQPHGTTEDPTDARTAFRLFYTLFRADAFREDPTLGQPFIESVFEESVEQGEALEDELTERVFDEVFLKLATGLYENWRNEADAEIPLEEVLDEIYQATLRLLYRLLFLLYAEERNLLPVRDRKGYYRFSLTRIAREAREEVHEDYVLVEDDLWEDLRRLFGIINMGEADLNVPTYNGHLFDVGTGDNAWLDRHTVPDEFLAPALTSLTLMDPDDPNSRGVDYKALDVRQLGSIYEGLLEHRLQYAEEDLAVVSENGTEVYEPLAVVENPMEVVKEGDLYLETDQSERKKTGSYYTPHYVVEYIVENTLGPILDERTEEFEDAMDDVHTILEDHNPDDRGVEAKLDAPRRRAREALLSLRVCDPAMGSGHFLVHAVDYLTNRIGAVALERDWEVNPIRESLDDVRGDVLDSLDEQDVQLDDAEARLDDFTLLKRLVMKRCIYGVDLNPMAVELAKLSLWLRSFTVGAPLSFLDHHLKPGNSLIGTQVDEVQSAIEAEGQQFEVFGGLFDGLHQATELMQEVARLSDATMDEVRESAERFAEYEDAIAPFKRILDLWVSQHFGNERADYLLRQFGNQVLDVFRGGDTPPDEKQRETLETALELSDNKSFFHWELEFPEVYYRTTRKQNPGFDAVIGNPPYRISAGKKDKGYFRTFKLYEYQTDYYVYFMDKSLSLVKKDGIIGQIVPDSWTNSEHFFNLRKFILDECNIVEIAKFDHIVFEDATIENLIHLIEYGVKGDNTMEVSKISSGGEVIDKKESEIKIEENEQKIIKLRRDKKKEDIIRKVERISDKLGNLFSTNRGVHAYRKDGYGISKFEEGPQTERDKEEESYHSIEKKDGSFYPELKGKHISRYSYKDSGKWISWGEWLAEPREWKYFTGERVVVRKVMGSTPIACYLKSDIVIDQSLYICIKNNKNNISLFYLLALLNSKVMGFYLSHKFEIFDDVYPWFTHNQLRKAPLRKIGFISPTEDRNRLTQEAINIYQTDLRNGADPFDSRVLERVHQYLNTEPKRADVVHDLLAHLAREMTDLNAERQTYDLDITNWMTTPSNGEGVGLREIGRYQPAPGVTDSLLADTTDERENLKLSRLQAQIDQTNDVTETVRVRATARFKPAGERSDWPDAVADEAEPDTYGYVETEPLPVCTLHNCTEIEAGLVVHWLSALNDGGGGFSGYRDYATKTNSLLDRIYDARFPDPAADRVVDALRPFLDNAQQAAELDWQIQFTDGLIDRIVYRLYGLTDAEIAVVEN